MLCGILRIKNKELAIKELKEYGFHQIGNFNPKDEYLLFDNVNEKKYYTLSLKEKERLESERYRICIWGTDCGNDLSMFLAIAALNKDNDYGCRFIHKNGKDIIKVTHFLTFKEEFSTCNFDSALEISDFHKMDEAELIMYFINIAKEKVHEQIHESSKIIEALQEICFVACHYMNEIKIPPSESYAVLENNKVLWKKVKERLVLKLWSNEDIKVVLNYLKDAKIRQIYDIVLSCKSCML